MLSDSPAPHSRSPPAVFRVPKTGNNWGQGKSAERGKAMSDRREVRAVIVVVVILSLTREMARRRKKKGKKFSRSCMPPKQWAAELSTGRMQLRAASGNCDFHAAASGRNGAVAKRHNRCGSGRRKKSRKGGLVSSLNRERLAVLLLP